MAAEAQLRSAMAAASLEELTGAIDAVGGRAPAQMLAEARRVRDAMRARARKTARRERLKAAAMARAEEEAAAQARARESERALAAHMTAMSRLVTSASAVSLEAAEAEAAAAEAAAEAHQGDSADDIDDGQESEHEICVVCMDAERSHLFVPCGHRCVCEQCSLTVLSVTSECPMCRQPSTQALKVFM